MPTLPPLRLTGAKVLMDGALVDAPLSLADGRIADFGGAEVDFSGYWILPAVIDLHGDGFEFHLAPRPSAPFPKDHALKAADRDMAASGVATAYLAQCWSWEGGARGADFAAELMRVLNAVRPHLLTDLRIQIRFETHLPDEIDALLTAVDEHGIDYVVFNDHIPEALEMWENTPERIEGWARQSGRSAEEHMAIIHAAHQRAAEVPEAMARLAEAFKARGVTFGGHDDPDAETRDRLHAIGAHICEFPTSVEAAARARELGDPVLMGAPNVVRGGSQSGNIAAATLVEAGLCDGLVSDYYPPALVQAAWRMADDGLLPFAKAWELISTGPAQVKAMNDRGALIEGRRADLVVLDPETRQIEATLVEGRIAWLSGEAGRRLISATPATARRVA